MTDTVKYVLRGMLSRTGLWMMACGALIAAALMSTPQAQASPWQYLSILENNGYYGPAPTWLQMGYAICNGEAAGQSRGSIVTDIVMITGPGIYTADAEFIVDLANAQLCLTAATIEPGFVA